MTTYTRDEAYTASLDYFKGDELAASVFVSKYALRDGEGHLLEATPADMHKRLASEFARIEKKYPNSMTFSEILSHLSSWEIVPQGSPMSAMGNPYKMQSLSNCFVIDAPQDSYGGILYADQEQAQIMKRRGGVGFDISTIRPKGEKTANAAGTTDGIGIFMERFSNTCREVAQGGRRGALMLTISVKHPEIETFINIKRDLKKVTGANISIRITDDFMKAVKADADYTLQWPVDVPVQQAKITKVVKAKAVWEQIVDSAWSSAEPGLLFWDTVTKWTPTEAYASKGYANVSTNPCSELILSAYDSCRLLLLNLTKFVVKPFGSLAYFDFDRFREVSYKAQKLMDDLVDLELEAIDKILAKIAADPETTAVKRLEHDLWLKIREATAGGRRTGLGVTGLGDALAMIGVKYGSPESIAETEKIYRELALAGYSASVDMARDRSTFPVYDWNMEVESPFLRRIMEEDPDLTRRWKKYGRRNIALTTTAPAGSVSVVTQTTSGIEPAFLLVYTRRKKITATDVQSRVDFIDELGDKWQEYKVYHHGFKQWMDSTGCTEEQIESSPYYGATSDKIDWTASVKLQAAAQKWVCHAISKTCNLPSDVSKETVADVYMTAWESGCKGFTVYRDGSRSGVLVAAGAKKEEKTDGQPTKIEPNHAPKRPKELPCDIHRINVKGPDGPESYLVLVGKLAGAPYEIFCGLSSHVEVPKKSKVGTLIKNGKKEGVATYNLMIPYGEDDCLLFKDVVELFANPLYGAFTRSLSLNLRHGIPVQYIVEQLQKDKHSDMQSFSRVIARVLKTYIPDGTKSTSDKKCPECGGESLTYSAGCPQCTNPACGWTKCS
jgi:ribonucleoside-diphosphate reductase alpha chain